MRDLHTLDKHRCTNFERDYMKVQAIHAADVAPVIHAYWIPDVAQCGRRAGWHCSVPDCGVRSWRKGNYCPNCGAKMDGEGKCK